MCYFLRVVREKILNSRQCLYNGNVLKQKKEMYNNLWESEENRMKIKHVLNDFIRK